MEYLADDALNIYTDGSCLPNPRRGGMGVRFVITGEDGEEKTEDHCLPGAKGATNNQMELKACVEALDMVLGGRSPFDPARHRKVVIFTDSTYVEQNREYAMFVWPTNHWTTTDGPPVENMDLWKALVKQLKAAPVPVGFKWIPGKKSAHAKAVDKLAKRSARSAVAAPTLTPVRVRRKKSPHQVDPGSVQMEGQRVSIYVSEDKVMRRRPRLYRYRYSVISEDSPYFERVDFIYSEHMLDAGHTYDVRFNADPKNPRIEEVYEEIEASTTAKT